VLIVGNANQSEGVASGLFWSLGALGKGFGWGTLSVCLPVCLSVCLFVCLGWVADSSVFNICFFYLDCNIIKPNGVKFKDVPAHFERSFRLMKNRLVKTNLIELWHFLDARHRLRRSGFAVQ
jgi:hypothetical protein